MHLGSIKPKTINTEIIINPQAVMPADINRINLAVFLFVFVVVTMKYLSNKEVHKIVCILALVAFLMPGIYMDLHYIYMNPSYHFRDTMIAMKDKVDDKVVAGGTAYGFRLYNRSIPIMDFYGYTYSNDPDKSSTYTKTLKRLFHEKKADYTLIPTDWPGFNEKKSMQMYGTELVKRYGGISLYRPKLE
jgi:hypothetical protein